MVVQQAKRACCKRLEEPSSVQEEVSGMALTLECSMSAFSVVVVSCGCCCCCCGKEVVLSEVAVVVQKGCICSGNGQRFDVVLRTH